MGQPLSRQGIGFAYDLDYENGPAFSKGAVSYNSFCFANNYKNGRASCKEDGHLQHFRASDP